MSEKTDKPTSWQVMPDNKKLYWKDGQTNLLDWHEDVQIYGRLQIPESIIKAVFVDKEIPEAWTQEWVQPAVFPVDRFEIALTLKQRDEHNNARSEWEKYKGKVTSFITLSQTESSKLRVDKYHEQAIKDHILACECVEIVKLIDQTHTFSGAISSFDDREKTEVEWMVFDRKDNNEKFEAYANRYFKMLEKCTKMGIKTTNRKKRVYRFLKGLREYNKSSLVQLNVLSYLALVDKPEFPKNLEDLIEELQALDQSENPIGTQLSNSNKFAVNSIIKGNNGKRTKPTKRTIEEVIDKTTGKEITFPDGVTKGVLHEDGSYQVMAITGLSKKFKKDSEKYSGLFKPSHVPKQPSKGKKTFENNSKPETRVKAQKLKQQFPNLTWKEIYKKIKCGKCGWTGHLDVECPNQDRENSGNHRSVQMTVAEQSDLPVSQTAMRNTSGYFTMYMTHAFSKPITEDQAYNELLQKQKNENYINMDNHANIHVFCNGKLLTNIRKVRPLKVKGFGGFIKELDTVGDHPLFGEVFYDPVNGNNIVSADLCREDAGYFRRTSKDNKKEFLYNEDLKSVITFDRDPMDGFYKVSVRELNREWIRVFPAMCQSIA